MEKALTHERRSDGSVEGDSPHQDLTEYRPDRWLCSILLSVQVACRAPLTAGVWRWCCGRASRRVRGSSCGLSSSPHGASPYIYSLYIYSLYICIYTLYIASSRLESEFQAPRLESESLEPRVSIPSQGVKHGVG